jgi:3-hydroxyisobutyrate dehydrogenase-like beta-hydroxyacid dehydrogenase
VGAARTSIGFVGLGNMGGNMAERLLAARYPVSGWQRSREHARHLIEQGLQWRESPRVVAEGAEVVVTSLPDDAVLDEVARGADGILAGLDEDSIWIDMSTVSPQKSIELAARVRAQDAWMFDAPVSGSVPQVQAGTLTIMVGGDGDLYRRIEPLLRELGTPNYIGGNGQGLALKLAINISLAVQMLAFAEGLLLAERSGIDRQRALDVMEESPIGSPMLRARVSIILDPPEEAWFDLRFMHKDIELALDAARRLGIPLPTATRADEVLEQAVALGYERRDLAALFEALEDIATSDP